MKEIKVLAFGAVSDIIGKSRFAMRDVSSTEELKEKLEVQFPSLKNTPYAVAVNKQLITGTMPLNADATVALLPPFSGG